MSVRTNRIAKQLDTRRSYGKRIEDSSIGWAEDALWWKKPKPKAPRMTHTRYGGKTVHGGPFPARIRTGFDSVLPVAHLQY